jgi:hypothetical protein
LDSIVAWAQRGGWILYSGWNGRKRNEYGVMTDPPVVCRVSAEVPRVNDIVCPGRLVALDAASEEMACGTTRGSGSSREQFLVVRPLDGGEPRIEVPYPPPQVPHVANGNALSVEPSNSRAYLRDFWHEKAAIGWGTTSEETPPRTSHRLHRWDLTTGKVVSYPIMPVWFMGRAPDGRYVVKRSPSGRWRFAAVLFDPETRTESVLVDGLDTFPNPFNLGFEWAFTPNMHFAVVGVMAKEEPGQVWLIRMKDLRGTELGRFHGQWALSPDGKKLCVITERRRFAWWRLFDEYKYTHLIGGLYVIDISGAYADLDGPTGFDVRDRLAGEWHVENLKGERVVEEDATSGP